MWFASTSSSISADAAAMRPRLRGADEVALADLDAVMPQDVVRSHDVEVEIRQHEAEQVLHAFECHLRRPELEVDVLLLAAVCLRGLDAADEVDRLGATLLQVG